MDPGTRETRAAASELPKVVMPTAVVLFVGPDTFSTRPDLTLTYLHTGAVDQRLLDHLGLAEATSLVVPDLAGRMNTLASLLPGAKMALRDFRRRADINVVKEFTLGGSWPR